MNGFLGRIVAETRAALVARQRKIPESALVERLLDAPEVRDFAEALAAPPIKVIAEIKRASPSAGLIRPDCDPAAIARSYEAGGAAAISVLTEERHFRGSLEDLRAARAAVRIPVLRKDFIVDRYQVLEARAAGADAALLIAAALEDADLRALLKAARRLKMECLVEVHSQEELKRVLAAEARIIGINNRDLSTFGVNLAVTERLMAENDLSGRIVVSESGINSSRDLARLARAGVDAVLVGTALMRADDPGRALWDLMGERSQDA